MTRVIEFERYKNLSLDTPYILAFRAKDINHMFKMIKKAMREENLATIKHIQVID
jgi:non-homologous end joining protein Ku